MPSFPAVCGSLAQAFVDDPFYRAVTVAFEADAARRQQALARYFALAIEEGRAVGEIQLSGDDGAAIWMTNEASGADVALHGAARNRALAALLGPDGHGNYARICEAMTARVPAHLANAWYLSILGVRPDARGRGLAQAMLEPTLARADRLGETCFLETFNPLSIPFYERLGFAHEADCFEAVTGRSYWILSRRASPHPAHFGNNPQAR
ncbi:GNAT family N-acetyltransferase [Burkholderia sp. 3C]